MPETLKQSSRFKRQCIGCNGLIERSLLLKITTQKPNQLLGSEENLVLDENKVIPGRSVYMYQSVECLEKIIKNKSKKKLFTKLLSTSKNMNPEVLDTFFVKLKSKLSDLPCFVKQEGEKC